MRPLILACGIWSFGLIVVFLGLITSEPGDPDLMGRIILDHKPFCESFVVQTERGFVILDWEDGHLTFGASDTIVGPIHSRGLQTFDIVGRGVMNARVYQWTPNLPHAERAFQDRCGLDVGSPIGTAFLP
jgi:hypothetical protein